MATTVSPLVQARFITNTMMEKVHSSAKLVPTMTMARRACRSHSDSCSPTLQHAPHHCNLCGAVRRMLPLLPLGQLRLFRHKPVELLVEG